MTRGEVADYIKEWLKDEYALNGKDRMVLTMVVQYINDTSTDLIRRQDVIEAFSDVLDSDFPYVSEETPRERIESIPCWAYME